MSTYILNIGFILLSFFSNAIAPQPHPSFRNFTVDDGLPSSEIYKVIQDREGFLWFATGNGISRYNGYEFKNFSTKDGLPDNTVFDFCEDANGKLWFVTISCKIGYYSNGKIHQYKYNKKLQKRLKNFTEQSFYVADNGTVYLKIANNGLYIIDAKGNIKHKRYSPNTQSIFGRGNKSKNLFSCTMKFSGNQLKLKENHVTYKWNLNYCKWNLERTPIFAKISAKTYLIALNNVLLTAKKNGTIKCIPFKNRVNFVYFSKQGELLIGTFRGGVFVYPGSILKKPQQFLKGYSITSICQDTQGGYWFTTYGNGVFYSPSNQFLTFDTESGLPDAQITQLSENKKTIFASTKNGYIYTIYRNEFTTFNGNLSNDLSNEIAAIKYINSLDELWVYDYIFPYGIKKNKLIERKVVAFYDIYEDPKGPIWLAITNGLMKYNPQTQQSSQFYPNNKQLRVNALICDKTKNQLFIGAVNGLSSMNMSTNKCVYLGKKSKLLQTRIMDLAFLTDKLLVIATKGSGMLLKNGNKVLQINEQNGLTGDNVYRLFVKNNCVWAATNKGLSIVSFNKEKPENYTIKCFTYSDGLPSSEINDVIVHDDTVWISSLKGLTFYSIKHKDQKAPLIPVYINTIEINHRKIPLKKSYKLPHYKNNLAINFSGINYKNPGSTKYRYKMIGLDNHWHYTNNREVQFTTLPPNQYEFFLSAQNSEGKWGNPIAYSFYIQAPIWNKWWFITLEILALIFCVLLAIKYRSGYIRKKEQQKAELDRRLAALQLKALRAQMNPHFTFNVMNSIQHYILNASVESAYRYLSMFSRLIRLTLNNSEKEVITLGEELKTLELYLELESMRFEDRFEYCIKIDPEIDLVNIEIPAMLIQPFVENSIKHGILPLKNKKGVIEIQLIKWQDQLKCIIKDNGIGRVASGLYQQKKHESFGSKLTHERLKIINSLFQNNLTETIFDLYDHDGNAAGTIVELFIPIFK